MTNLYACIDNLSKSIQSIHGPSPEESVAKNPEEQGGKKLAENTLDCSKLGLLKSVQPGLGECILVQDAFKLRGCTGVLPVDSPLSSP